MQILAFRPSTQLLSHFSLALLRPGRFEVQIEIPPPRTTEQRVSILKVHTKHMLAAGRLQVNDPPQGSTAEKLLKVNTINSNVRVCLTFDPLQTKRVLISASYLDNPRLRRRRKIQIFYPMMIY